MLKISIITINYNNVDGLRRTLASVAAQTYRNIEHIIVDGGSTDGSVEVIKEYAMSQASLRHSIIWKSEPDHGIYNAMNRGILKATGDYIWILNSGDCAADENVVARMMEILERESYLILLGNKIQVYPENRKEYQSLSIDRKLVNTPNPIEASMLTFYSGTIPQDAAFVRRDIFEKYGLFDESMKICADWKLYLNIIASGGVQPMYVNIDVVLFDMSGVSNANNEQRLAERREYLEQVLPKAVIKDYDAYAFPIHQYQRLKKYHLWGIVYFVERILFKLEKWHILR